MFSIAAGLQHEAQSVNGSQFTGLRSGVEMKIVVLIKPKPINEAINRVRAERQKVYRGIIKDSEEGKISMEDCMYIKAL